MCVYKFCSGNEVFFHFPRPKYIVEILAEEPDGGCLFPRWFIHQTDYAVFLCFFFFFFFTATLKIDNNFTSIAKLHQRKNQCTECE